MPDLREAPMSYLGKIPEGYAGTAATVAQMHALTKDAVQDDQIVRLARELVQGVPPKRYDLEAATILRWVQENLRYVQDPYHPQGLERLQHPKVTIFETRSGDCDELAPAFSALCAAIGHAWGFRTVGSDPLFPNRFKHVYSLVYLARKWIPADPSIQTPAKAPLGWEPPADESRRSPIVDRVNRVTSHRDWFPR